MCIVPLDATKWKPNLKNVLEVPIIQKKKTIYSNSSMLEKISSKSDFFYKKKCIKNFRIVQIILKIQLFLFPELLECF